MTIHIWAADPDLMILCARRHGEQSWVEFRAPTPYHEWGEAQHHAAMLHDALEGWHACVLHTADPQVDLLPRHPDYARVDALMRVLDRARFPFVVNGRVVDVTT